jgi:iron complex transport system permease protein
MTSPSAFLSTRRPAATLTVVAVAVLVILSVASLFVGVGTLSPAALWVDGEALNLMLASRLPRTVAVVLTGAGLAIAGLVMQTLARNRFVEPMTAGTGQSAALGILAATIWWPEVSLLAKAVVASATALGGTAIFLALAHRLPPAEPYLVPLFGIVFGGIVGALVTGIAWQADLLQFQEVWQNGEFSGVLRGRYELLWGAAVMVVLAFWVADRLTLLSLGRDVSIGLGLNYERMLQLGLLIVSVIAALTVVIVGIVPFVGLVVPALASRLIGDDVRASLPTVALFGAILVLVSDIAGRLVVFPYEIPVGTVLGVVGAACFLAILGVRFARG